MVLINKGDFFDDLYEVFDREREIYVGLNIELGNIFSKDTYNMALESKEYDLSYIEKKVKCIFEEIDIFQEFIKISDNDRLKDIAEYKIINAIHRINEEIEILGVKYYDGRIMTLREYRDIKRLEFESRLDDEDDDVEIPF